MGRQPLPSLGTKEVWLQHIRGLDLVLLKRAAVHATHALGGLHRVAVLDVDAAGIGATDVGGWDGDGQAQHGAAD